MSDLFASFLPDSIIKRLSLRARELGAINLGQGIPSFPTPPHIISAAREALGDPIIGVYPNFLGEEKLRYALALRLNREHGTNLTGKDDILVTVGAMEATASSVLGLVANGDRVGIISPNYCNHMPQVWLARGEMVEVEMKVVRDSRNLNSSRSDFAGSQKRWMVDFKRLEKELKKGLKLLILTNPSNPTGAVATRDELEKMVSLCRTYGTWFLADETYSFATYEQPFTSLLDFWNQYDRLLVVRSFSKEYAMTGWRVGYLITRSEPMRTFTKVHDALVGTAPKISQRAAIAAITGPQDCVRQFRDTFLKRRNLACSLIDAASGSGLSYAKPLGAYYLFVKYEKDIQSVQVTDELLTKAEVAVVPGSAFGAGGEQHFRISYAVEDTVLQKGIESIISYFSAV